MSPFFKGGVHGAPLRFGRWVKTQPRFGSRHIPENKSCCKQSITHNTPVADEQSQNRGDTAIAEARWGELHFCVTDQPADQGGNARAQDYYDGVDMQRNVLVLQLEGIPAPVLLDLYPLSSSALPAEGEVIFSRIGANDPQFNLRSTPGLIVRTRSQDQLFATGLETHRHFDESTEVSENARGDIERCDTIGYSAEASVVRRQCRSGQYIVVM